MGYFSDEPEAYYFETWQEFNDFLEKHKHDGIRGPDYYAQVIIKAPCGPNELSWPITQKGHRKLLALAESGRN